MLSIVLTEFQKIKRYHILLVGVIGMTLSPVLGIVTQNVAMEEAKTPDFNLGALINNTIWNNAAIFMPVIFTLIGGYLINREHTDDTLKNILVIPVSFPKLLTGKLIAAGLLSVLLGFYSFVIAILIGVFAGLRGMDSVTFINGLLQMIGISVCTYIAVLPILALCGKIQGLFPGGSMIAFLLGYCSIFFKSGMLRNIYPFLASFAVIGFDTTSYIGAKSKASVLLGIVSLGMMLLLSAFIILISKTPEEIKIKRKKNNLSLRPAQRERIKTNRY